MIWAFLICCIPLAVHLVNDARGDNKKGNDLIVLTIIAGLLAWVNNVAFDIGFIQSLALMAGLHIAFFSYVINIILFRRKVIEWPAAKMWWKYTGKSSKIDQWVAKIDWRVRLLIRILVLIGALFAFLLIL